MDAQLKRFLLRTKPEAILSRVHKAIDHRARITGMGIQIVEPRQVARRLWLAAQITIILHRHKRIIDLRRVEGTNQPMARRRTLQLIVGPLDFR